MNELKKNAYGYFYGGYIGVLLFILLLTFNYVGIYYIARIIYGLIIILLSIWIQKIILDVLINIIEKSVRENKEKKLYHNINFIQVISGTVLCYVFIIVGYYVAYLPTYIHEIGHVLTALSFKADVAGVFLSPLEGTTFFEADNLLNSQYTIIAASGCLGVIIFGSTLLFLFYWDDRLTFKLYLPTSFLILVAIITDLYYFFLGAVTLNPKYDISIIIQLNPGLNRLGIAYWCLFGGAMVFLLWIWSVYKKMKDLMPERTQNDLNHNLP